MPSTKRWKQRNPPFPKRLNKTPKKCRLPLFLQRKAAQSVKKVEVQEALPPAGVIGAEPLILVPQHFSRKPA